MSQGRQNRGSKSVFRNRLYGRASSKQIIFQTIVGAQKIGTWLTFCISEIYRGKK